MNDMSEKVSAILSDPESVQKIMALAKGLGAGTEQSTPPAEAPSMVGALMPALEAYTQSASNPKVQLLMALKPMVSEKKRKNIDDAISILRLAGVAGKLFEKGE